MLPTRPAMRCVCQTAITTAVNANTSLKVDQILDGNYFATTRGIVFNWHQDHESYFTWQNQFDYLNFYLPIVKPLRNKTNLCIVPFDVLETREPQDVPPRGAGRRVHDLRSRRPADRDAGSARRHSSGSRQPERAGVHAAARRGRSAADAGDILHKTEDNDTDRVSLSIRAANSRTMVRRAQLADGGLVKASVMSRNQQRYLTMFRVFDEAGRSELPLDEFLKRTNELGRKGPPVHGRFRSLLIREKLRSGVFLSFVRKALSEKIVRPVVFRYHWREIRAADGRAVPNIATRTM